MQSPSQPRSDHFGMVSASAYQAIDRSYISRLRSLLKTLLTSESFCASISIPLALSIGSILVNGFFQINILNPMKGSPGIQHSGTYSSFDQNLLSLPGFQLCAVRVSCPGRKFFSGSGPRERSRRPCLRSDSKFKHFPSRCGVRSLCSSRLVRTEC